MHERDPGWDAGAYHDVSAPQLQWGLAFLERADVSTARCILDAGCGTGRLTRVLAERAPTAHVIAADASLDMLHVARANLGDAAPRISLLNADLSALPLRNTVDLVFSTATFHWVRDHARLFAELHRALRPGGRLAAQCGGGPNLARLLGRADALMREPRFAPYFTTWQEPTHFADREPTARLLHKAGFDDIHTEMREAPTTFADAHAFRRFIQTVVLRHHVQRLPAELATAFLDHLVERAAHDQPPFTLDYWRLNIFARRKVD